MSGRSSIANQRERLSMHDAQDTGSAAARADVAGARHLTSRLMRESLVDKQVLASTEGELIRILPWANVIKIGGRSIIDRGREALLPLIDEIAANLSKHKMIIGAG